MPERSEFRAWSLTFSTEQETDGRWIAEVAELPGVLAYGATEEAAATAAKVLALRVLADRVSHREIAVDSVRFSPA